MSADGTPVEDPAAELPVTGEPGTEEPGTEEPGTEEPGTVSARPRAGFRRWFARGALWLAALAALFVFLLVVVARSDRAREQARLRLGAELSRGLDRAVEIGALDVGFLPLVIEVRDLEIAGRESGDEPVLELERARVELGWLDLWRREPRVRSLELFHPRMRIAWDENGEHNFPRLRGGGDGGEFRLDTLVLEDGHLELEDVRIPLSLVASDVRVRLIADEPSEASGQVSAKEVVLDLPGGEPYALELLAQVRADRDGLAIEQARIKGEDLAVSARGRVVWEPEVGVDLDLTARGQVEVLTRLGYLQGDLAGAFESRGKARWRPSGWTVVSSLRSPRITWLDLQLSEVAGALGFEDQRLTVDIERSSWAGGTVAGRIAADFAAPDWPLTVELGLVGLSLDAVLADRGLPLSGFASQVEGEISYTCGKSDRQRGSGWGQLYLQPIGKPGLAFSGDVPLSIDAGVVSTPAALLIAEAATATTNLSETDPPMAHSLLASGSYDWVSRTGAFTLDVDTQAVAELTRVLMPYLGGNPEAAWVPSSGHGTASGMLSFRGNAGAAVELRVDLADVVSPELEADHVRGGFTADPAGVHHLNLELERASGALLVTGGVAVVGGRTEAALAFDAVGWPLAEIRSWRELGLPLRGEVAGRLTLDGPAEGLVGRFEGAAGPASVAEVSLDQVAGTVEWDRRQVRLGSLAFVAPAGRLTVDGTIELGTGELELSFAAPAVALDAAPVAALTAGRLAGRAGIRGQVRGTKSEPRLMAAVSVAGLSVSGRALRSPAGAPEISELELSWDGQKVVAAGTIAGFGTVRGGGAFDRESFDLAFEVATAELAGLLELASGQSLPDLAGELAGELAVKGRVDALEDLSWRARLSRLSGTYGDRRFRALEPVVAAMIWPKLEIASLYLAEEASASEAFIAGEVDLAGTPRLALNLQASFDTRWLDPFLGELALPADLDLHGRLEVLGRLAGAATAPRLDGQAQLTLNPFVLSMLAQPVEGLVAQASIYPDRIELEQLAARVGRGTLRGRGRLDFDQPSGFGSEASGAGALGDYRFYLQVDDLKLLLPEGWLEEGDAEIWLTSTGGRRELAGTVELSQVRYLEEIDVGLLQVAQRLLEPERQEVGPTEAWLTGTQLDLAVRAPDALRVRNRAANLRGDVDLSVRGTLARPVLLGKVDLLPGGTLRYADNEYEVRRGLVTFNNPYQTEAVLDLEASARVRRYEVTLSLSGTPDHLSLEVASDPPLPQLDVMALVAGGRPLDPGARPALPSSTAEGQLDAQSFLYGQAASALTERVNTLFGFDKFRVDPLSQGGDSVSAVRVTVGKRLSKDLFVTYSSDPSSTEGDVLEAEWQVSPQLMLVFTQNGDGSFAVDALWDRQF